LIKAGDITIRDLGTSFNIKAYPEDNRVETSLFEGSADILSPEGKPIADLKPGQSAVYSPENKKMKVEPFSQNIISAWKDGKFVIRDQSLEDIFKELSRWYDVEFKFENNSIRNYRYTGNIRKSTTPQHVLKMLQLTTNFNYRIIEKPSESDEIIIY
jgi:transmembrane sensor